MHNEKAVYPNKHGRHGDDYSGLMLQEYVQCLEEGMDIEQYHDLFKAAAAMPAGNIKEDVSDALYRLTLTLGTREGYRYSEPDGIEEIRSLADGGDFEKALPSDIEDRIRGAWYGRICGCLLGKPIEGIRTEALIPLLQRTNNFPMHRYILASDITEQLQKDIPFDLSKSKCWADTVTAAPADDDTNYTVMSSVLIDRFGRNFKSDDVLEIWTQLQPKNAYFTAERVAYINYINKYISHDSAIYKNPYREWIGAQIRVDYYGYINAGRPAAAAEMAYRDAYASHTKNGIYGAMFIAALIARAAVSDDITDILNCGLAQIPRTSRLHQDVSHIISMWRSGSGIDECREYINSKYDEHTTHGWCHTVSNAMIVTMALLYGGGDYGTSICAAVQTGFDTDCNGATVGSVIGMMKGSGAVGSEWTENVHGRLQTCILGMTDLSIDDLVKKTLSHLEK